MFTGIIQGVGQIEAVMPQSSVKGATGSAWGDEQGLRLMVSWGSLDASDVTEGDSVALNGACMTVLRPDDHGFAVDVSRESLEKTVSLDQPGPVNLEKALRLQDRLGGHLVSGHIDGTAQVLDIQSRGESTVLKVLVPVAFAPYLTPKGSVALHGVSLTVNQLEDLPGDAGAVVTLNLIPHTWAVTTLRDLGVGSHVNFEADQLAKQVARMVSALSHRPSARSGDAA
jgi:riboflavin synthase